MSYQKCPVCNGCGSTGIGFPTGQKCSVCNGTGIISEQTINYNVHLEVDVEFLAKILSDCASDNGFDYSTHGINVLSECIATNIPKWARLVRK